MSWGDLHRKSSELAFEAARLRAQGNREQAQELYCEAARADLEALDLVPDDKNRTKGIVGVSAASLFFKGHKFELAERVALNLLRDNLEASAKSQLQAILQAVWNEVAKQSAEESFLPGEVIVSISGGEVVSGGAPMDLILTAVQTVQSIVYRTVEYLLAAPLRKRGPASQMIKDTCRPWLFHAPAGSYQFALAIQGPTQPDFFRSGIDPAEITDRLIQIVQASGTGDDDKLTELVQDEEYRIAFTKLTRNLLPKSNRYEKVRIYSYDSPIEANLGIESNRVVGDFLQSYSPDALESGAPTYFEGVLRALDLNRDWLEVDSDGKKQRISGLQEAMDDVVGPMVNRRVRVKAHARGRAMRFDDIELID